MLFHPFQDIFCKLLFIPLLIASMANASAGTFESQMPRAIHITGTGKASAAPDKADLNLSVEIQAKSAEAARKEAADTMEGLIKTVKATGVADKDIQTRSVALYPTYSANAANTITGYQLTNQVTVCIRNLSHASAIIDNAVKAGGNSTRVQGITFAIDNPEATLAVARDKAFANAKAKAQQYAKLAGVSLGSVLQINEASESSPAPMPYAEMRAMKTSVGNDASTPLQAGEQEVTVNVDVTFGVQ